MAFFKRQERKDVAVVALWAQELLAFSEHNTFGLKPSLLSGVAKGEKNALAELASVAVDSKIPTIITNCLLQNKSRTISEMCV